MPRRFIGDRSKGRLGEPESHGQRQKERDGDRETESLFVSQRWAEGQSERNRESDSETEKGRERRGCQCEPPQQQSRFAFQ